jgi:hypothetical protein
MSTLNGPSEGTWSVFALKVVEERDRAQQQLQEAKQEIIRLKKIIQQLEQSLTAVYGKNY